MKAQIRITRIRNIAGKTLRIDSSGLERLRNVKESIMDSVTLRPIKFKYSIVFWHQLNQHFHTYQELKDLRIFFASFLVHILLPVPHPSFRENAWPVRKSPRCSSAQQMVINQFVYLLHMLTVHRSSLMYIITPDTNASDQIHV